ncbi:MAG: hypothetical protein GXP37_07910, partial [Chloroflexi bacterium]|nr:hypothetical protein [Chloroflexota bacterium]
RIMDAANTRKKEALGASVMRRSATSNLTPNFLGRTPSAHAIDAGAVIVYNGRNPPVSVIKLSTHSSFSTDYAAALQGTAYSIRTGAGLLTLTGAVRLPFLDRQTANAIKSVVPGDVITTVLTSATARILDGLHVFATADGPAALPLHDRCPSLVPSLAFSSPHPAPRILLDL